jgi:hypothetical protein
MIELFNSVRRHFNTILNSTYTVIFHAHKKFSQCMTCFLFKRLLAMCKTDIDKKHVREHRRLHFQTVFEERVKYRSCRNFAKDHPEDVLSMIIDAQTAWRTQGNEY